MQHCKNYFLNFAIICLLIITLLISGQVFLRNFYISSIPDYIQITEILIAFTILFPLANLHSEHLKIHFFLNRLSQKTNKKIDLFSIFLVFLTSIFIGISAWNNLLYQWNSQNYFEGDLSIPRWLPSLFFFFILMIFFIMAFFRLINFLQKK